MKQLFELGNRYAAKSDWKDFALTKFCLCAMGIMIGLSIPAKKKKYALAVAAGVFAATYIVLMDKVFAIAKEMIKKD